MYEVESIFADSVIKCPKRSRYVVLVHCLQHFDPLSTFTYTCKMDGKATSVSVIKYIYGGQLQLAFVLHVGQIPESFPINLLYPALHKDQPQDPSLLYLKKIQKTLGITYHQ